MGDGGVSARPDPEASPSEAEGGGSLSGAEDDFGLPGLPLSAGTRLGDVTLVRFLAAGGMGAVYEGRQDAPSRAVAVKVLRNATGAAVWARRFALEAELLARVEHPHIARIHSAGTSPTPGGPVAFFVMELIAGARSITEFAVENGLSPRDRVTLFATACDAVAHAHRMGVIHRDLKPGNLLVDAIGQPKVIDFGIARGSDGANAGLTTATRSGEVLGTLRYMSPEQLGLDEGRVDARSDVYALGLVLHELLVGSLPYELRGRTPLEAACILGRWPGLEARAAGRRFAAEGLAAADAFPLAVIAATCLEQRAADRYQSAGDLHADLARWLAGEPIRARPPTLIDSLARLVRRHRVAAAFASLGLAALVAAVVGVSAAWVEAERQRRTADAARAAAELGRGEADRRAAETRAELYRSTVLLAAEARDRDHVAEARRLLAEATALAAAVPGTPVELDCLATSLDEAIDRVDLADGTVTAVAWTRDGLGVVAGTAAGGLHGWHREATGAPAARAPDRFDRHAGAVWSLAFSPDGRLLASASADGTVRIHDAESGRAVATLTDHVGAVYAVCFSPDGSLLATSGRDGTARLWQTVSWEPAGSLVGHRGTVYSVRFAPAGSPLLTASLDGTARLWDAGSRREIAAVRVGDARVFQAVFTAAGHWFATASEDGTAQVWETATRRRLAVLHHPQRVNAVAFLAAGEQLVTAAGDGVVRAWDVASGRETTRRRGHAGGAWSLADVPGTSLVATGSADGCLRLLDLAALPGVAAIGGRVQAVAWSPDGRTVAAAAGNGAARLIAAETLEENGSLPAPARRLTNLAFAPSGRCLAAADDEGHVHRWEWPAGRPLESLRPHRRRVYAVAFSPDESRLATASEDRTARVLATATGGEASPPLKHPGRVFGAAFTPDGGRLVTACEDGIVRIWNATGGNELAALTGHSAQVNWVALSPDGSRLATASSDGTCRLWHLDDGRCLATLSGPARQVWRVAFSPDGGRIAAVSADGGVHLWDASGGRPVAVLRGHADQVWGIAFSPDGRGLASGGWDGTVRRWGAAVPGRLTGDE